VAERGPWRSIRVRVTAAVLSLVVAGLAVIASVSVLALSAYLQQRVDDQLTSVSRRLETALELQPALAVTTQALVAVSPPGVAVVLADGDLPVAQAPPGTGAGLLAATAGVPPDTPVTVTADGVERRAIVLPIDVRAAPDGAGGPELAVTRAVVGLDVGNARFAIRQSAVINAAVGGAVLALLVPALLWVLRTTLRPVGAMARDAAAVAAGDVARRLPADTGTELDELAGAVNTALDAQAAAERRLRSFVADASHELRTPLTTIAGWAELYLQGGVRGEDQVEAAMTRVEATARRMRVLVDDLLVLARADPRREGAREPVDLVRLLHDAAQDARAVAPGHRVEVAGPDAATVVGDPLALQQVVGNLVGNALAHTPAGTRVRTEVLLRGGTAVLVVADDGPGMPAADAARAFERFRRGTGSTGSGLGLAIVHAVVTGHGGTVELTTGGTGTTVTVTLPAG
jgi:two-component system, OmpR family, sensor kinase